MAFGAHLARLGSQSHRVICFILPARRACHIIISLSALGILGHATISRESTTNRNGS